MSAIRLRPFLPHALAGALAVAGVFFATAPWRGLAQELRPAGWTFAFHASVIHRWARFGVGGEFVDCIYGEVRGDTLAVAMALEPVLDGVCSVLPKEYGLQALGIATGAARDGTCGWTADERLAFAGRRERWWIRWCSGDLLDRPRFTAINREGAR